MVPRQQSVLTRKERFVHCNWFEMLDHGELSTLQRLARIARHLAYMKNPLSVLCSLMLSELCWLPLSEACLDEPIECGNSMLPFADRAPGSSLKLRKFMLMRSSAFCFRRRRYQTWASTKRSTNATRESKMYRLIKPWFRRQSKLAVDDGLAFASSCQLRSYPLFRNSQ